MISRDQLQTWAGRALTDEEVERVAQCVPRSTIPEAFGVIAESLRQPAAAVWLQPLLPGGREHGSYADEVVASEAMDALGLTDRTHKLVWRYPEKTDPSFRKEW